MRKPKSFIPSRRRFIQQSTALGALAGSASWLTGSKSSAAIVGSDRERPNLSHGLQFGDPRHDRGIVWARADRPSRMWVEWSTHPRFRHSTLIRGPHALDVTDYCTRLDLRDLPAGEEIFVRVHYEGLDSPRVSSEEVTGSFRTAPQRPRDVRIVWGGDTCGQGWGINLEDGGMRIYETMRSASPDLFIHSGDSVYADGPMRPEVTLPDGSIWTNAYLDIEPAKLAVAQSLDEFRGCYRYNLLDENVRAFNREVAQIWQWDDHEVTNNWSDAKDLSRDDRYDEKSVHQLIARATRAYLDYSPMRPHNHSESERIYRKVSYGPDIDVFVLDMRSYRAGNSTNRQAQPSDATRFLGEEQLEWLKRGLKKSSATWKLIAADMPIGLMIRDGQNQQGEPLFEGIANGDGPVLGREHEIAELLRDLQRHQVSDVVWLTADVHYCAAHYYEPQAAEFRHFDGFWEFVAGPLHAGSFGPNALDNTFGPQVVFQKAPPSGQSNLSPREGLQFFGQIDLDRQSRELTVSLRDIDGSTVFSKTLAPSRSRR